MLPTSDMETRHIVLIWKRESKPLGIVIYFFDTVQSEGDEALVTTSENCAL